MNKSFAKNRFSDQYGKCDGVTFHYTRSNKLLTAQLGYFQSEFQCLDRPEEVYLFWSSDRIPVSNKANYHTWTREYAKIPYWEFWKWRKMERKKGSAFFPRDSFIV